MMSSLYVGASGMKSQGEGIGVISQNLSNVNTLGYKQLSIQYSDLMSQYMTASSGNLTGAPQKGLGATTGAVRTLFTQGGFEAASAGTDLYIDGQGFFGVSSGGKMHYTRAGNFRFDNSGALLDPSGWNVLGRPIVDGAVSPQTEPIRIDISKAAKGSSAPKASSTVLVSSNLGGLENKKDVEGNPFFSLASSWNANANPPLPTDAYSYSDTVQFYDSEGTLRTATLYYDLAGKSDGNTVVEYTLALPPDQDASALGGSSAAGLLMAGTITFDSSGAMANMTAFSPPANGDPSDLSGWTPALVKDGKPAFSVKFKGQEEQTVALDMGFSFGDKGSGAGLNSAAEAAAAPESIYARPPDAAVSNLATVMQGSSPGSIRSTMDGYAAGSLRDVVVGKDGVVKGIYSNGQEEDFYQLTLYRFTSQDGLRHEGGNHYSATPESGPADEGQPGVENFGSISANTLELSNVDYAREFSLLIVTQRGFQMNSKVVTTSDSMLQKALELKR